MTDHVAGPNTPASSDRVAELHRLADEDYAKGQQQRAHAHPYPTFAASGPMPTGPAAAPSDLDVAIRAAQQVYDSDHLLAVREALRLVLRALGAEPAAEPRQIRHANGVTFRVIPADSADALIARNVRELTMADGSVWTVGAPIGWRGIEAAWRTPEPAPVVRCPAALPDDRTPCGGPVTVMVLTARNAGAKGCEHHAARLLATLPGSRPVALPDAPEGAAIRAFKAAGEIRRGEGQ